ASMLGSIKLVVFFIPIQRYYITKTGGVPGAIGINVLVGFIRIYLPYPGMFFQERTRIHPWRTFGSCLFHAGIGGRTDIHIHISAAVKSQRFGLVLILGGKSAHDQFRSGIRQQRTLLHVKPVYRSIRRCMNVPVINIEASACKIGKGLLVVKLAVSVIVSQSHSAMALIKLSELYIKVSVVVGYHVAGVAQVIS